jgi:diguanylate cyclase (GGDEF)-like protein
MEKMYDDLTGLYTFEGFQVRVEAYFQENNGKYLLILFDIDNFKMVNNLLGLNAGDRLLNEIGETLRRVCLPATICCRIKGDSYCAFVPCEYGHALIDQVINKKFYAGEDKSSPVQIKAGVYPIADPTMPVSVMCDRAAMALSTIKGNQLEQVAYYDEHLYHKMVSDHELTTQLESALENGELKMYLQSQVDRNGMVIGAEALVRWEHPTRGLLLPGDFIPLFEKNYQIARVDRFVWEEAARKLKEWEDTEFADLYISVNISPRDFESMNVYHVLTDLVEEYGINPKKLRVEITETTIMQNPWEQIKLIGRLRQAGFYVEMDDFGSGYSSFSMLKDIKLDAIKLDMRFLSASINTARGKKILSTIVTLARELQMTVVAEGVEKREHVEYLKHIGCELFQGYYFARPVNTMDFEDMVHKTNTFSPRNAQ